MTDLDQRIVIVGAGQAGLAAAAKLRALGHRGDLLLLGAEPHAPYQRPPLSKGYVLGDVTRERLFLRPDDFYADQGIDLYLDQSVHALDCEGKRVILSDDTDLAFDKLILTTGATPIRLPAAIGGDLDDVFYMRDLVDADSIRSVMTAGKRVLVVGGGYIGLEGAAVAAKLGLKVTLVEAGARILGRVASTETADFFRTLHRSHGVDLRENVGLTEILGENGQVRGAVLSDGTELACDLVLVGIGVRPNCELAEQAGLAVENGIRTDAHCRTSDSNILAAGDCASFPWQGAQIRLESVGNAIEQAEIAAANVLGLAAEYVAKPWFWSDQYDVKLQIAGLSGHQTEIVVRKSTSGQSHWYFEGDALLAVDALNDPRAYMVAKRLIDAGRRVDKAHVADPTCDLKLLLKP